jgi:methyl-accepting chemotaxis protein
MAAQGPAPQKFRRRWRNFLLDRNYQLKYSMVMVVIAAVLTAGLGYGILKQTREVAESSAELAAKAREASRIVELQELGAPDDPSVKEMKKYFSSQDAVHVRHARTMQKQARFVPYALVAFFLLLSVALLLYGIVITHRVAGPLFKISNYLKRITDGRLGVIYDLRKTDELQEFFATFKQMHGAIKQRTEDDATRLGSCAQQAEALAGRSADIAPELRELAQRLRNMEDEKKRALE